MSDNGKRQTVDEAYYSGVKFQDKPVPAVDAALLAWMEFADQQMNKIDELASITELQPPVVQLLQEFYNLRQTSLVVLLGAHPEVAVDTPWSLLESQFCDKPKCGNCLYTRERIRGAKIERMIQGGGEYAAEAEQAVDAAIKAAQAAARKGPDGKPAH